jgi:hypothetical protein
MSDGQSEKVFFTVSQLIEALKAFPAELPVVTSGYENGYENIYHPAVMKLKHEPENMYYDGEFQTAEDGEKGAFEAVVLGRVVRDD